MNKTKIPWATHTWNPIVGCSPCSDGCSRCYAAAISKRFHLPWGSAHFMPERLSQPAKEKKPARIFVCSMSDLGHETVEKQWREMIYQVMRDTPWHAYLILTKRPAALACDVIPENAWIGVTAENQEQAEKRIPILLSIPAKVHFVSVEPMLEEMSLTRFLPTGIIPNGLGHHQKPYLALVIAGPENGPGARECRDEWIDRLAAESPCFFDKRDNFTRREYPV